MSPMVVRSTLHAFRQQHGVGLRRLAAAAGLPPSTITRLESGRSRGVDYKTLDRLLGGFAALGVTARLEDILVYEGVPLPLSPPPEA